jgi:3-mercaptopyruvate sulfurtransferase SseA
MTLKPGRALKDLLQSKGILSESEINTYCQGGARDSLSTIVLKILGYKKVRTHADSYVQWAKQPDTSIETGV